LTAYALRALAGFVSHRRRSWDSPFGAFSSWKVSAAFPRGRTHLLFRPPVFPLLVQWAGPTGCSFWALTLPGVPGGRCRISASATGCSLGFFPLRVFRKGPCQTLVRLLPRASRNRSYDRCRRRPGVSIGLCLAPSVTFGKPFVRTEQPLQGSGTGTIQSVRAGCYPGYVFTSCRVVHYCQLPAVFG